MKIFSPPQKTTAPKTKSTSSGPKKKLSDKPVKKEMSADAIKEKLASHVDTSDAAKNMAIKSSKKMGDTFLNPEAKPAPVIQAPVVAEGEAVVEMKSAEAEVKTDPNKENFVLNSDIAKNDPKDTNTQEKLKTVLSRGAFNFSARERDALEKILGN
jgi:hypothetical protein